MIQEEILGQNALLSQWNEALSRGRVPHALLLSESGGYGALPLAWHFATALLCASVEGPQAQAICRTRCAKAEHPDLHFIFPVATTDRVKSHPRSELFLEPWRQFLTEQPYASLNQWYKWAGLEKKQGMINVDEAEDLLKKMALKSYEGGAKVVVIWEAHKMNTPAANKLLKLIEEPPAGTYLLLVSSQPEQILQTIYSRCQHLRLSQLSEKDILGYLSKQGLGQDQALYLAQQADGDLGLALEQASDSSELEAFERWFVEWVRAAFRAKGNKAVVQDLLDWSLELAGLGREQQKQFLSYCTQQFRLALLVNYGLPTPKPAYAVTQFKIEKFAPFVHENNIEDIRAELEKAQYHIERNVSAKMVFGDLALALTRFIHRKPTEI